MKIMKSSNTTSEIIQSMMEKLGLKIEITPDSKQESQNAGPRVRVRGRGMGKGLGRGLGKGRGLCRNTDVVEDENVEDKECPGSKIRSKGKGKGLGYGKGKGPIGIPINEKK